MNSVATNGPKSKPGLTPTSRCNKPLLLRRRAARPGVRHEAIGAIGGAIGGDAGKGAAIGAGVGAAGGAMRRRQAMEQQAAAQEKAKQAYNADVGGYKRAFGACMTGRGYTVS